MQWEDNLDTERASSIARRFAIEDLALKYRTSLKTAEQLLATGVVVDRQTRVKSPKSPDLIEVDDSPSAIKVEVTQEDMDVDIEGLQTSQRLENSFKQGDVLQPTTSPSSDQAYTSPRSRTAFSFPSGNKTTNYISSFQRHSYPTPRFASQTWPYCVTYPYLVRNRTLTRSYPFLYTTAGAKPLQRNFPFELLKNRYQLAHAAERTSQERPWGFGTPEERYHVPIAPVQSPTTFASSAKVPEERPRTFEPLPDERSQTFVTSEKRPRTFLPHEQRSRVLTLEEETERFFNEEKSQDLTHEGEISGLYGQRPRSYTSPGDRREHATGHLKDNTIKPRRHSDDSMTNVNRPSVIVMQRSLSNPSAFCKEHKHGPNDKQCADENHFTDSDSSATPPLAQEESPSSSEANKGKTTGK